MCERENCLLNFCPIFYWEVFILKRFYNIKDIYEKDCPFVYHITCEVYHLPLQNQSPLTVWSCCLCRILNFCLWLSLFLDLFFCFTDPALPVPVYIVLIIEVLSCALESGKANLYSSSLLFLFYHVFSYFHQFLFPDNFYNWFTNSSKYFWDF